MSPTSLKYKVRSVTLFDAVLHSAIHHWLTISYIAGGEGVTECLCFPPVEPLLVSVAPSTSHTPISIVPTMCECSGGQPREFPSSLLSHELCLGKPLK